MGINPDAVFLRALERWDATTQLHHKTGRPVSDALARERLKMPLFHEVVVRQARPALSARSLRDAYLITLNERGGLNFGRMAELLGPGSSQDNVRDALAGDGLIFDDPEAGWQTADAYLSGNVKRKLAMAQRAAVAEPRFERNVEALQLVIPADILPGQIEVRLGSHWIPASDVNQFLAEVLDAEQPRWSRSGSQFVHYVAQVAERVLETEPIIPAAKNFGDWGTHRAAALSIVLDLLNGRLSKVVDELDDGRRVVNQQETLAAQEKAEALQRRFVEWLWSDAERAERLATYYNDTFNAVRPREYDGAHLTLPGSNPAFTLRPHQKAAVWRILQESAVGLFHEVGAGKTTVMAAAAMELRRLGLASKILIVVPSVGNLGSEGAPIGGVRVASHLRGRGLGHRLFEWTIAECRRHGSAVIELLSDNSRTDAHHFYETLGFTSAHVGMRLKLHVPRGRTDANTTPTPPKDR
jgi:N12 class adenine-specific DNA methylase